MPAYYNENDLQAAQWLRNLISKGLIAPGDVDSRDIRDVTPDDLRGYTQCHFFAGIGVWSAALRLAGWPDDLLVWTGSCPCQPFSSAGQRRGAEDDRHLWPVWRDLISAVRPPVVFGEQVASAEVLGKADGTPPRSSEGEDRPAWFDAVSADLEEAHYACGALDIPAAGFGAPHIRQRLYFGAVDTRRSRRLGHRVFPRLERYARHVDDWGEPGRDSAGTGRPAAEGGPVSGLEQPPGGRRPQECPQRGGGRPRDASKRGAAGPEHGGPVSGLEQSDGRDAGERGSERRGEHGFESSGDGAGRGPGGPERRGEIRFDGLDNAAGARHVGSVEEPEGEARDKAWLRVPSAGLRFGGLAFSYDGERDRRPETSGGDVGVREDAGRTESDSGVAGNGGPGGLADPHVENQSGRRVQGPGKGVRESDGAECERSAGFCAADRGLGDPRDPTCERDAGSLPRSQEEVDGARVSVDGAEHLGFADAGDGLGQRPSPTNGFWGSADWLFCRDGKWRPVESGLEPLVDGAPARLVRLRAYGNAIVRDQAAHFIQSFAEAVFESEVDELVGLADSGAGVER